MQHIKISSPIKKKIASNRKMLAGNNYVTDLHVRKIYVKYLNRFLDFACDEVISVTKQKLREFSRTMTESKYI